MTQSQEPNLIQEKKEVKVNKKRPWVKRVVILLTVLAVAGFGVCKFLLSSYPQAQGKARSGHEQFLEARIDGILKEVHVTNSEKVKKGEVLFEFVNDDIEKDLLELRRKKESLDESLKFTEKEKKNSEKALERARILFENGVIGKGEYEGLELKKEKTETDYFETSKEFEAVAKKEEILVKEEDSLFLKAPFDGIFLGEPIARLGNYFKKEDLLGLLFDPKEFYFEALFDEKDASKIKIGDGAEVIFNAFPGVYKGEVSEIDEQAQLVTEKVYKERNVIKVKIKLEHFPRGLKPFMKGKARVVAALFKNKSPEKQNEEPDFTNPEFLTKLAQEREVKE